MKKGIQPAVAPNLPMAPDAYSRVYLEQLTNAMRLYFAAKDSNERAVFGSLGGQFIANPYLFAEADTDQYATDNTPTTVKWTSAKYSSGFSLLPDFTSSVDVSGVYRLNYEMHLRNNDTSDHDVYVWLMVNDANIKGSCKYLQLRPGYTGLTGSQTFEAKANDVFSLVWATDQAALEDGTKGVYLEKTVAQETPYVRPATPSALGSVTFLSALQG